MEGWMEGRTDGGVEGWRDGGMGGWMGGWMEGFWGREGEMDGAELDVLMVWLEIGDKGSLQCGRVTE